MLIFMSLVIWPETLTHFYFCYFFVRLLRLLICWCCSGGKGLHSRFVRQFKRRGKLVQVGKKIGKKSSKLDTNAEPGEPNVFNRRHQATSQLLNSTVFCLHCASGQWRRQNTTLPGHVTDITSQKLSNRLRCHWGCIKPQKEQSR